MTTETNKIEFTRITNDMCGNPRYVCHFLELLSPDENAKDWTSTNDRFGIENKYRFAVKRANKIGGRKFHNKQYGGGIVFQSYNISDLERRINELISQK